MQEIGKMLPNLHHLTIASPLKARVLGDKCLKSLSKLEELIIYDGDLKSIKAGVFRNTPLMKHLSIKYSPLDELTHEHFEGLEEILETLVVTGTPIKFMNMSKLIHLTSLDISQNRLTSIQREMFPKGKTQFSELNISYNPIKNVENGFLSGIEMKNHLIQINGWEMETFDLNAFEGMEKLHVIDLTKNMKMKKLQISDPKKFPVDVQKIILGRSPFLKFDNEKGHFSKMLIERNMTLVLEGKVACGCEMKWMIEMEKTHPHLIEIDRSRAVCSREGTVVDQKLPELFWTTPTVFNFFKSMKDDKTGLFCKKTEEKM